MTTPHTLPIAAPPLAHEHGWVTLSRHPTSDGIVTYVRCVNCGAHRVDLQPAATTVPSALSITTPR